nr:hypothetical protein CFP56_77942 [Quercus suber]
MREPAKPCNPATTHTLSRTLDRNTTKRNPQRQTARPAVHEEASSGAESAPLGVKNNTTKPRACKDGSSCTGPMVTVGLASRTFRPRARLPGCHASLPPQTPVRAGRKLASRACLRGRLAQKRVLGDERHDNRWFFDPRSTLCAPRRPNALLRPLRIASATLPTRPQVKRDYPLSLSISISGGKETYKDSLSNGERTGNSPA